MAGIELVKNKETKESFHPKEKIGIRICKEARKQGLIIRPLGDTIVIMPPLTITREQLKNMAGIIKQIVLTLFFLEPIGKNNGKYD
jgi:adenosylmethionine-8-amino-7-oxononanoate aminotransferase